MLTTTSEPAAGQTSGTIAIKSKFGKRWLAMVITGVAGGVFLIWLYSHSPVKKAEALSTADSIAVVPVIRKDLREDLLLSGEFYPFQEIALHAKVSGYLKSIRVDVGDRVKEGDKIAELEIPELEDDSAKADSALLGSQQAVDRAVAEYNEAHLACQRLLAVQKANPRLVAEQDLDNAKAREDAMKGALGVVQQRVQECRSDLGKIRTMVDYAFITIPFDGIITKRFADPGALIQAGISSSTQSMPLVELAQENLLRLEFPVPESVVPLVRVGASVEITVSSLNEKFWGKISRFSGKVDRNTRTMHTEVEVPNPDGRFKPGMYANVRLVLKEQKGVLAVPVQALITGQTQSLFTLGKNGVIEQRTVSIGLQTPDEAEVRSGVQEGDWVIVGNRSNIHAGAHAIAKQVSIAPAG